MDGYFWNQKWGTNHDIMMTLSSLRGNNSSIENLIKVSSLSPGDAEMIFVIFYKTFDQRNLFRKINRQGNKDITRRSKNSVIYGRQICISERHLGQFFLTLNNFNSIMDNKITDNISAVVFNQMNYCKMFNLCRSYKMWLSAWNFIQSFII